MRTAAGRLFVDVTPLLASPVSRKAVIDTLGKSEPLIKDALLTIVEREDFIPTLTNEETKSSQSDRRPSVFGPPPQIENDNFLDQLVELKGGQETRDAINAYLDKYGMRGVGEIDITRTRWSEKPTTLLPIILSNIKNFEPGAGKRKFEQGRKESLKKEQELLDRLKQLPAGENKAEETKQKISLIRNFADYREYPKRLVTEVGGLMTHGAVIAREYGLPAVVGVENATKLIKDGARIRVNGTEGYVEINQQLTK